MIPRIYAYVQSIVFAITYHPSYGKRKRKDFSMEKPSARGLKMLFNFFQRALVARDATLAWLLFKAWRSKRRGKMCESMITRGIMRVGVWKVSKCISPEPNGANIFRNVRPARMHARCNGRTRTFALRCVCALRAPGCRLCSSGILSEYFSRRQKPRQTGIYGSDEATCCAPLCSRLRFQPVCGS